MDNYQEQWQQLWKLTRKTMFSDSVLLRKRLRRAQKDSNLASLEQDIATAIARAEQRWTQKPRLLYPLDLPILQKKDEIVSALKQSSSLIVSASTGSGKSTQLAKFCLEAGLGRRGKIVCVQPRRIAAICLAKRIARELQEDLGRSVDYLIRFDDKTVPDSFIRLMTDGMLLAKMQQDPSLWEYEAIIIDEAHERSLNIDLLLGLLTQLRKKRPQLHIIIASATLDAQKFCAMWQAPLVHIETALFPIEIRYRPPQGQEDLLYLTLNVLQEILQDSHEGDVLIFMPCEEDIHQTIALYQGLQSKQEIDFFPLYGRLPQNEQQKVFAPSRHRKVIVATNIAETSLTIDGIYYVIDTGLARISQYSSTTHLQSLPIMPISRSSADQRKGRCGRIAPGICYRLYSQEDYETRPEFTCPEIQRSNLSDAVLRMLSLGIHDLVHFPFPDPPQKRYFHAALINLHELSAITQIDDPRLTHTGKILAHLPVDPRLGRILLAAVEEGCLQEILIITAGLAGQEIRERPKDKIQQVDHKHAELGHNASDFLFFLHLHARIIALAEKSQRAVRQFCQEYFLSYRRVREWLSLIHQLGALMKEKGYRLSSVGDRPFTAQLKPLTFGSGYTAIHRAILHGYVRYVSHLVSLPVKNKTHKPVWNYQSLQKKNLKVMRSSALYKEKYPWMMSAILLHTHDLIARMNAAVDQQWIIETARPLLKYKAEFPAYSTKQSEVVCQLRGYWGDVLIDPGQQTALIDYDPTLAKELFIRNTLAAEFPDEERLKFYPFWQKNLALKQEIENLEHKLRQKNFYAGDEAVYQFYDRVLPTLGSWTQLDQYLRTHSDADLYCTRVDLLARTDIHNEQDYPHKLFIGEKEWPLIYTFDPGSQADGYTIQLHSDELELLDEDGAAWGIPGQFADRIERLVRNLPKEHRIKLHPIRKTCEIIVGKVPRQGHLFQALQQFCQQEFQAFIPQNIWRQADEKTPEYLRPRYALIDYKGREIAASRSLQDLKKVSLPAMPVNVLADLKKQYEQNPFQTWPDFALTQPIPINKNGTKIGACYPVFQQEGDNVALRLITDKNSVQAIHLLGCRALLFQYYKKELNSLKKSLEDGSSAVYFSYFGGTRHFTQLFWQGALLRYFTPELYNKEDWQHCNSSWLQKQAQNLHKEKAWTLEILQSYTVLKETLAGYTQKYAYLEKLWQEMKDLLDQAVGPRAWTQMGADRLQFLPVYIKSLQIRAQRAIANPAKDKDKAQVLQHLQTEIEKLTGQSLQNSPIPTQFKIDAILLQWNKLQVKIFTPELSGGLKVSLASVEKILQQNS